MTEPYRIRTAETWDKARRAYLSGLDAETVCRRHDLGLSAFRRRARKYGWRRVDQADPTAADDDINLDIYDDLTIEDQVTLARQRFNQALAQGSSTQALRWRRLWQDLVQEREAFDKEFYAGMTREQRLACRDRMERELDELDALELGLPPELDEDWDDEAWPDAWPDDPTPAPRSPLQATAQAHQTVMPNAQISPPEVHKTPPESALCTSDQPTELSWLSPEIVHDVHSDFSAPPPSRAERRRQERAARRRLGRPLSLDP